MGGAVVGVLADLQIEQSENTKKNDTHRRCLVAR